MENYAGYLAFADDQIGRLIDSTEQVGELDNTDSLHRRRQWSER
jgi:arylsulfatase A-like enzyme